jgi:O-antigen/teichoic acid export membrane protein
LYIYKRSTIPAIVMLISAAINLGSNFLLVPKYGIVGAAIATLIGYVSYVIIIIPISFKYLAYKPDFKSLGRYLVYSTIMLVIIKQINIHGDITNLLTKISIGISVYTLMILAFEPRIRKVFGVLFRGELKMNEKS